MTDIMAILELLTKLARVIDPMAKLLQKILAREDINYEMKIMKFNEYLYRHFGSYFYTMCTTERRYLDLKSRNSRTGLNKVFDALSQDGGPRIIVIWSEGGMGKTALATHIVRTAYLRNGWFSILLGGSAKQQAFIDGELITYDDAVLSYSSLLNLMGAQLGAVNIYKVNSTDEKLRFLQRKLRNQKALIVIDNLETLENTQEIVDGITRIIASTKGSRALITTRDGQVVSRDLLSVHLPPMTTEEGIPFAKWYVNVRSLDMYSTVEFTADLIKRVVNSAGGSPLAIEQLLSQVAFIGAQAIDHMREVSGDWKRFYDFLFSSILYSPRISFEARRILWYVATLYRPSTYADLEEFAKQENFSSELDETIKSLVQLDLLKVGRLPLGLGKVICEESTALYSVSPLLTNYILRHREYFNS